MTELVQFRQVPGEGMQIPAGEKLLLDWTDWEDVPS